jgi:hypothetical protein
MATNPKIIDTSAIISKLDCFFFFLNALAPRSTSMSVTLPSPSSSNARKALATSDGTLDRSMNGSPFSFLQTGLPTSSSTK